MSELQILKQEVCLIIEDALTCTPPSLFITLDNTNTREEVGIQISEHEALQIICHLIKVFAIPNSNVEVIHFPVDCNRAEVLRAAADRLDAGALFDGSY
jgi:hypothetical protein